MTRWRPKSLGLHGKLTLTYLVVGLSVSALSLFSTRALQRHASIADATRLETSRAAQDLAAITGSAFEEGLSHVLTGDDEERASCFKKLGELRADVSYLLARPDLVETEAVELRGIGDLTLRATKFAGQMFDEHSRGESFAKSLHSYEDTMDEITTEAGELNGALRIRGAEEDRARRAQLEHALLGIALGTAGLCVALGSVFGKRLTRPIVRLRDAAIAFGRGATPLEDEIATGDEIGELAVAFRDMAANVRRLVAKEAEQRARLENVFASMREMVIVASEDGHVLSVNRSCQATLEFDEADLVGQPLECLFESDPGSNTATSSSARTHRGLDEATVMRSKGGRRVPVSLSMTPMLRDGRRDGVVLVAQDLTERKQLESELRQAQKLEAVGRLASGIAHEINTPIQFVSDSVHFLQQSVDSLIELMGEYQLLRKAVADGSPTKATLTVVIEKEDDADLPYLVHEMPRAVSACLDGLGRVATIVRSMKEFAHPGRPEMAAVDLNRAILSTLTISAHETKLVADLDTHFATLPPVFCHVGDINQVVLNLIVNAAHAVGDVLKATGARGRISVRTQREGDFAVIVVADTGGGIPKSAREQIFDPFFTTKGVGVGTGQGLAIARSVVVDKHGGTLTFESETGIGTTFFVRIPIERASERAAA
jgi:PAS domain S-box-containing protein